MKKSNKLKNTVKTVGIVYKSLCELLTVCVCVWGVIVVYYCVWTYKWCLVYVCEDTYAAQCYNIYIYIYIYICEDCSKIVSITQKEYYR